MFNLKKYLRIETMVLILTIFTGIWFYHHRHPQASSSLALKNATVLNQPRIISTFKLTDMNGKPFTNEKLTGHWSLVFFGFTRCPMICPTALSTLNDMYQKLQTMQQSPMPQVIFVSVDPERDTPEQIKNYLLSFNKQFIGATGDKKQIDKLAQELSSVYMKVKQSDNKQDDNSYSIDHSAAILLINPNGQFYGVFSAPQNANDMAADVTTILTKTQH